nr:hypothetical protein CTI12_AA199580 [Tanacetum cinerariifolium]
MVSYFDDLDFLKDFKNEFPAIFYNDALKSKSDSSTKPVEISHRIDEFDLKIETSLSECDEEEQNIVYFNDLFPFNIIYPDDLKSDKDNDDNEINIIQSSEEITTSKDLWVLCQAYGKVVDVFIPNRKSKVWKRFAFVRFIKMENVERLVGNLCTLWIGCYHLQANVARFKRKSASSKFVPRNINEVPRNDNDVQPPSNSYVSAVKGSSAPLLAATLPAIVLDEECLVDRDLDNSVMGEVHHFSSLNNLRVLLYNEGFADVEIMYLAVKGSSAPLLAATLPA